MKIIKGIILIFSVLFLVGCTNLIEIPDVTGADIDTAKTVITDNRLIPIVSEEYSNSIDEGTVIRTYPVKGEEVEQNTQVKIYVSKGPSMIISKESVFSWFHVQGSNSDKWNFYAPKIDKGILVLELLPEINSNYSIIWKDYGEISLKETLEDSVPIEFTDLEYKFVIKVPIDDLGNDRPTKLYLQLHYTWNDNNAVLNLELNINW